MRTLALLRAARQAVSAAEPLGCALEPIAVHGSGHSAPLRQLTSLLSFQVQHQQRAGYAAARRKGDESDDEELAAAGLRHGKLSHSERRLLIERKLRAKEQEEAEDDKAGVAGARQRRQQILGLLEDEGHAGAASASQFVSRWVHALLCCSAGPLSFQPCRHA